MNETNITNQNEVMDEFDLELQLSLIHICAIAA